MITWHIVSLASILGELLLFLKVQMYQLGMVLIIVTGLFLVVLGMWIGGDDSDMLISTFRKKQKEGFGG